MFHQVRVSERDADSLRFLWHEDVHDDGPPQVFQMLVHIFGARDSQTRNQESGKGQLRRFLANDVGNGAQIILRS